MLSVVQTADVEPPPPEERPLCPKCGSPDVRRSHDEGAIAAVLRMLGRWPFRCRSCRSRFYLAAPPPEA
jgi:hypothetical protein